MKLLFSLASIIIASLFLVTPVYATAATQTPPNVTLEKNVTIKTDYFAAGNTVTVSGTVEGDAYIAGETVFIDGTIKGDLFVAGGTVFIQGPVLHDLRAAGGNVVLQSTVAGNATIAGGTVTLEDSAKISGSLLAGAGTLAIFAPVGKDMTIGGETIVINAATSGNVKAAANAITLMQDASIKGNLTHWSQEFVSYPEATVSGIVIQKEMPKEIKSQEEYAAMAKEGATTFMSVLIVAIIAAKILWEILLFLMGILLFHAMPEFTKRTISSLGNDTTQHFIRGIAIIFVFMLVAIGLCTTIVGIPFGIATFFMLWLLSVVVHMFSSLFLGVSLMKAFHGKDKTVLSYLIGLISLFLLSLIPVVGAIGKSILGIFVLGAIWNQKTKVYQGMRKEKLI